MAHIAFNLFTTFLLQVQEMFNIDFHGIKFKGGEILSFREGSTITEVGVKLDTRNSELPEESL